MRDRSLWVALGVAALLAAMLALVGGGSPASAGDPIILIPVETTDDTFADDGLRSLREAVSLSNSNGTVDAIRLQVGETYELDICAGVGDEDEDLNTNGDLDLLDGLELTIEGQGATIVQTCDGERVFDKLGTGQLVLQDVTITGGSPDGNGGGVLVGAGVVMQDDTRVEDNTSFQGGGIHAGGHVQLNDSAVLDNTSFSGGGGIYGLSTMAIVRSSLSGNESFSGGGAIFAEDDVSLVNATITRNMAANNGGVSVSGQAFISYSTLVANGSRDGFGGANLDTSIGTTVFASVIALGGNGDDCDGGGNPGITSFGYNVGSDGTCGFTDGTDRPGVYPHLITEPQPAGAGVAYPPVRQSEAVDLDPPGCDVTEDQAGTARPVGSGCDAGSIEVAPPPCTVGFGDVGLAHAFFEEICWMDQTRISTGFPGDLFKPSAPVTRQAMAAFIYRLAMEPPFDVANQPSFNDVGTNHPFFLEIEWMADTGIATGFDGDVYKPGSNVSRQAMAAFMYRVAGEPVFNPVGETFTDVSTAHPFYDEIEWMADEGISNGFVPGPTYRPSIAVSRQAMAAFLLRLAEGPELLGL
jgi:predicted outer membrane repeat protein